MESRTSQKKRNRLAKSTDLSTRLFEVGSNTFNVCHLKSLLLQDSKSMSSTFTGFHRSQSKNKHASPKLLQAIVPGSPSYNTQSQFYIRKTSKNVRKYSPHLHTNETGNSTYDSQQHGKDTASDKAKYSHLQRSSLESSDLKRREQYKIKKLIDKVTKKEKPIKVEDQQEEDTKDEIIEEGEGDVYPEPAEDSSLDEYIRLITRNTPNIDEFLYLVKRSVMNKDVKDEYDNIYQLEIVSFEQVKELDHGINFEYYMVSRKGFCHYINGKPNFFIEIEDWLKEKEIYERIKQLKFFSCFRRWKTVKMWKKNVIRHRINTSAALLEYKLFLLNNTMRTCLFEVRAISLDMDKSIVLISKNEGDFSIDSFRRCQERNRRETSNIVYEYSCQSRRSVKTCFESSLTQLRQHLSNKPIKEKAEQGQGGSVNLHNGKDNAFRALGFPSKMPYENRSKLRKMAGRFVRFSYLVDLIYLNGLAGIFTQQVSWFIGTLEEIQLGEEVRKWCPGDDGKGQNQEEVEKEKMFQMQIECTFKEIPDEMVEHVSLRRFEFSEAIEYKTRINFIPVYHVRLKSYPDCPQTTRKYVPKVCSLWLSLRPNLDQILDELNQLIKEGLESLKSFYRWSKHREMQKYVNILEEWDDIVSDNWQVSENSSLDPMTIIGSYDVSLSRVKDIVHLSEKKLNAFIQGILTEPLNSYWENQRMDLKKLDSEYLTYSAEAIELFLGYVSQQIDCFTRDIPQRVELGIFSIELANIKNILIRSFYQCLEAIKERLPDIIEQRTNSLNEWLNSYVSKLKEYILKIDDFVRMKKVIQYIEMEYPDKKYVCNSLGQLFQTMQAFRIDTRKRKDFYAYTLKLKDQLEQAYLTVEQLIERKSEMYIREVMKYHLPNLIKDIYRVREQAEDSAYLSLTGTRSEVIASLQSIEKKCAYLIVRKQQCQEYIVVLKLTENNIDELEYLEKQIASRLYLWQCLYKWYLFTKSLQNKAIESIDLRTVFVKVCEFKTPVDRLSRIVPANDVLNLLLKSVNDYYTNIPLLEGFHNDLAEKYWAYINNVLYKPINIDLHRKDFTMDAFFASGIGKHHKEISAIFEHNRLYVWLQRQYQYVYDRFSSVLVRCKMYSRFNVISNVYAIMEEFNIMLSQLTTALAHPFASGIKQYTVTYESIMDALQVFENWVMMQKKLIDIDHRCRQLDIKKLQEYSNFENAYRIYKNITKLFVNKINENGVRLNKLFAAGVDDKINYIGNYLRLVEESIQNILAYRRKAYPQFYLLSDDELLGVIADVNQTSIGIVVMRLIPGFKSIDMYGYRITGLVTIDDERVTKNSISTSQYIEYILEQVNYMVTEVTKRTMRTCRYKTIEANITGLVDSYNVQYLLAICKVDFNHYTEISIENQNETPEALQEFFKVMRKDTTQGIRAREKVSKEHLPKYDSLLLQYLMHEEILERVLKFNVLKADDFNWQNELRFGWDDSGTDEPNIIVRQLHIGVKYGSKFVGSKAKPIQECSLSFLTSVKFNELALITGSSYAFYRLANSLGYQVLTSPSFLAEDQLQTVDKQIEKLKGFIIGCAYADYFAHIREYALQSQVLECLMSQNWLCEFKEANCKKGFQISKYMYGKYNPVFLGVQNYLDNGEMFRERTRVISFARPNTSIIKNYLKIMQVYDNSIVGSLARSVDIVADLEANSRFQNICVWKFLDSHFTSGDDLYDKKILILFLDYIRLLVQPAHYDYIQRRISTISSLRQYDPLALETASDYSSRLYCLKSTLDIRRVLILVGRGSSKRAAIKKLYEKTHNIVLIYSDLISPEELNKHCIVKAKNITEEASQPSLLYFEGVNHKVLMAVERIIFGDMQMREIFFYSGNLIVFEAERLADTMDPRLLTSFAVCHFEFESDYIREKALNWSAAKLHAEQQKYFHKHFNELALTPFESWNITDVTVINERINTFFTILYSLLPVSNLLYAMVYALIWMHGDLKDDIKLYYFVKKMISEDKIQDGDRISNLIYAKAEGLPEGLVSDKIYQTKTMLHISEDTINTSNDTSIVITSQFAHYCLLMQRVYAQTESSVFLEGPHGSGKSTLMDTYRRLNRSNTAYLRVSLNRKENSMTFNKRLSTMIQQHSLTHVKAKVNYQETMIIIDDCSLADEDKIARLKLIKLIHYYKVMDMHYPRVNSQYKRVKYQVYDVQFMLAGDQCPHILSENTIRLKLKENVDLMSIYVQILTNSMNRSLECPLDSHLLQRIVTITVDVCKRVYDKNPQLKKMTESVQKNLFAMLQLIKIKDTANAGKYVERLFVYALTTLLDGHVGIVTEYLRKNRLDQYTTSYLLYSTLYGKQNEPRQVEDEGPPRLEHVRDVKRFYNVLNEQIEAYNMPSNESKTSREVLEFLYFDETLSKVMKLSNCLTINPNYLLFGRGGIGKNSIAKLAAFVSNLNYQEAQLYFGLYKNVANLLSEAPANCSYLLFKRITTKEDVDDLFDYFHCDFETEILDRKYINKSIRVTTKEKDKNAAIQGTLNMTRTTLRNNALASITYDSYVLPRKKLSSKDVSRLKSTVKVVLSVESPYILELIPPEVQCQLIVDCIQEIPRYSFLDYNKKLLALDNIYCSPRALQIVCELYDYSKAKMNLSLKSNDDAIRLYASFVSTLAYYIPLRYGNYAKLLLISDRLKEIYQQTNDEIAKLYDKLKLLTISTDKTNSADYYSSEASEYQTVILEAEQYKCEIYAILHSKSTLLSNCERMLDICNITLPSFCQKQTYLLPYCNKEYLEESFAIIASYVVYLSRHSHRARKSALYEWYFNVPCLRYSRRIDNFLPLFELYYQDFNTEPVDDLPDFYYNMVMIFHSIKPVIVEDACGRGRAWLEKNCSFVVVSYSHKDFFSILADQLGKPTNILIEITNASTLSSLSDSPINNLLYLSDETVTVTLENEEIVINRYVKVYLLLGENVEVPLEMEADFTVVKFSGSEYIAQKSLEAELLLCMLGPVQLNKLEYCRKIRNLQLDCESSMKIIADNIYEQFGVAEETTEEGGNDGESQQTKTEKYSNNKKYDKLVMALSVESLSNKLSQLADKSIGKAQTIYTKIKEKMEAIRDLNLKVVKCDESIDNIAIQKFQATALAIKESLVVMASSGHYYSPTDSEFLATLREALNRRLVQDSQSLLLFAIRYWGQQYTPTNYLHFVFMILLREKGLTEQQIVTALVNDLKESFLNSQLGLAEHQIDEESLKNRILKELTDKFYCLDIGFFTPYLCAKDPLNLLPIYYKDKKAKLILLYGNTLTYTVQVLKSANPKLFYISSRYDLEIYCQKTVSEYHYILLSDANNLLKTLGTAIKSLCGKITIYGCYIKGYSQVTVNLRSFDVYRINIDNTQDILRYYYECRNLENNCKAVTPMMDPLKQVEYSCKEQYSTQKSSFNITEYEFIDPTLAIQLSLSLYESIMNSYEEEYVPHRYFNLKYLVLTGYRLSTDPALKRESIKNCIDYITLDTEYPYISARITTMLHNFTHCPQEDTNVYDNLMKQLQLTSSSKLSSKTEIHQRTQQLRFQLGWWKYFKQLHGCSSEELTNTLLEELQKIDNFAREFNHTPELNRSTRRSFNMKGSRESIKKVPSKNISREKVDEKQSILTQDSSPCSSYLGRELEHYDRILRKVHLDIDLARKDVGGQSETNISEKSLILLAYIERDLLPGYWKVITADYLPKEIQLSAAFSEFMAKRNYIFTMHQKSSLHRHVYVDLRNLRDPLELIKTHFRTEFLKEQYQLSSVLSSEDLEKGEYLKILTLFSSGWKLSVEGYIDPNYECKVVQLSHYYLIRKNNISSAAIVPVELYTHPSSRQELLRVFVMARKVGNCQPTNKLYLRNY